MSSLFARLREIRTTLSTVKLHVEDIRDYHTEIRQLKEVIEEEFDRMRKKPVLMPLSPEIMELIKPTEP
jgi:prefoldin subunit 5